MYDEDKLLVKLKQGSYEAFTELFEKYYKDLVLFAGNFLQNQQICEDIVQNVFLKIWSNKEFLTVTISLKSFLIRSVQNACLDELRHKKIMKEHANFIEIFGDDSDLFTEDYVLYSELKKHLDDAIKNLPEKNKIAFEMHRIEGYKYREIADKLSITERVVEGRIIRALIALRKSLKEFMP